MKIFLDTSSLFKIYHEEDGSLFIKALISQHQPTNIFLCTLAKVEFKSAVWKKLRTREIEVRQADSILLSFKKALVSYDFIPVTDALLSVAENLVFKYRTEGLRTLDSVQLATCVALRNKANLFLTSDNLLKTLLQKEGLPAELPKNQD